MDRTRRPGESNPGGFTLVELLVVIAIIGVLMAVLVPALRKARMASQQAVCTSNMRQWGVAYMLYANANKGSLPDDGEDGTPSAPIGEWDGRKVPPTRPYTGPLWINALPPLVQSKPYFQMQADNTAGTRPLPGAGASNLFVCPAADPATPARPSDPVQDGFFMLTGWSGEPMKEARKTYFCYVPSSKLDSGGRPVKLSALRPGSQVVLMTEKRMSPAEIPNAKGPDGENYFDKTLARIKSDWQRFAGRHNKGGNLLFADGHVSWFSNLQVAHPTGAKTRNDWNQPLNGIVWNVLQPAN